MSHLKETFLKIIGGNDLSFVEAKSALTEVMSGDFSDILLGAWLTALKIKGETSNEISGCASVMQENATFINVNDPDAVDIVGTGGDGAHTVNISTAASIVAAASGLTLAKHGNRAVSSKSGSADVLASLGVNINLSPVRMEKCLNSIGIAFLFAPALHPAMKHAVPIRKALGIRTIFNILGPLSNPAGVKRAVIGVYDKELCYVIAEASLKLGAKHLMVVHGNDGLDEISTTGPTTISELKNGSIKEYSFSPEDYGIKRATLNDLKGKGPEYNASVIRDILDGKKGAMRDIIVVNSAAALIVSGKFDSWGDAIKRVENSIDNGDAKAKLNDLVNFSK